MCGLMLVSSLSFAEEIVVYGPESMKWVGSSYGKVFKQKTGDTIKYVSVDGVIPRMKLEKKNPKADIVLGLTDINYLQAKRDGLIKSYRPKTVGNIRNSKYIMDKNWYVTPIDYGMMAFNYNYTKTKGDLTTFKDLKKYPKQLLLQDPRSFTGEGILLWSIAVYGKDWLNFWKEMKPYVKSVSPDWSASFAKFTVGDGAIMAGYATSSMYFYKDGNQNKFKSYIPKEGAYIYLEGASLVNKSKVKSGAQKFLDLVLDKDFQKLTVEKNYMLPVVDIPLPESYKYVPRSNKILRLRPEIVEQNIDRWKKEMVEVLK